MRFLLYSELKPEKGIPYSRSKIDRLEKEGIFPRRVRLGPGTIGWVDTEIDEYKAALLAKRDQFEAA